MWGFERRNHGPREHGDPAEVDVARPRAIHDDEPHVQRALYDNQKFHVVREDRAADEHEGKPHDGGCRRRSHVRPDEHYDKQTRLLRCQGEESGRGEALGLEKGQPRCLLCSASQYKALRVRVLFDTINIIWLNIAFPPIY